MNTLHLACTVEDRTELTFVESVHVTQFLLLLKLHAVLSQFLSLSRTVVTRRVRTALQFFAGTSEGNAETTGFFPSCTCASSDFASSLMCLVYATHIITVTTTYMGMRFKVPSPNSISYPEQLLRVPH